MLAEEIDLDLLAGEVELGIGHHVSGREGDDLGALGGDVEGLDQGERVSEVDVVVGEAVDEEERAGELGGVGERALGQCVNVCA